jgi:hypothetical protein
MDVLTQDTTLCNTCCVAYENNRNNRVDFGRFRHSEEVDVKVLARKRIVLDFVEKSLLRSTVDLKVNQEVFRDSVCQHQSKFASINLDISVIKPWAVYNSGDKTILAELIQLAGPSAGTRRGFEDMCRSHVFKSDVVMG